MIDNISVYHFPPISVISNMRDNVRTRTPNNDALCKHGHKNNYILIQSSLSHVYVHYEDTRLREITLLPMRWSDVV